MKTSLSAGNARLTVVLSGGETGGHLFLALAVAECIQSRIPGCEIIFVGSEKGRMGTSEVFTGSFKTYGLRMRALDRKNLLRNALLPFCIFASFGKSLSLLRRLRPAVVIGVGGYASGPVLLAASAMRIPTVLLEPNVVSGLTNRLLKYTADRVCISFEETARYFPAHKTILTGTPVRQSIRKPRPERLAAHREFGTNPEYPTVLFTGGSLGAPAINETLVENGRILAENGIQLLWQTGEKHLEDVRARFNGSKPDRIRILPFIQRMDLAYALSDLVVSAAGAVTLAELAVLGKPAIVIPSPDVTENHQRHNALHFSAHGVCLLVDPRQASKKLIPRIMGVMESGARLRELGSNIARLARPKAAESVFEAVATLIRPAF